MEKQFKLDIFTCMDLEMNQTETDSKIIQIGAVVGNVRTGEVLEKLSVFINPNEILNPRIIELTHITQEQVDSGVTIKEGYKALKEMHNRWDSFVNVATWGGGDTALLKEQLLKEDPNSDWCFGRRWIDVKTLFVSWRLANNKPVQGGLAKAMTKVGLKFDGKKHNGMDDALNTFYMFRTMLEKFKSDPTP